MKNLIGIMQGRLSPPVNGKIQAFPWNTWKQEFYYAREIGIGLIDWVVEKNKFYENPLLTEQGTETIKTLISKTGVHVDVVCADYFIDYPLIRCPNSELKQRLDILELLIDRLHYLNIKFLEIPFVDNSAIKNKAELEQIIKNVKPKLEKAYRYGVTLAFETSLPPEIFSTFLKDLNHPAARANYDMGNSASMGYNPKEELESYGELVTTVHVKDRILKGESVPLGQGDTNFATCFSILKTKKYDGPFILQVARTENEIESAKENMLFVKKFLDK